jgi:hypothetical protein
MRELMLRLCLCCAALSVSACAGKIPLEQMKSVRHVAVASTLGDEFHGIYIGTTILTNKYYSENVAAWKIDAVAAEAAAQVIRNAQYQVSVIEPDPSTDEAAAAQDAAKAVGADHVLLIRRSGYDNQPTFRGGYGYHRRSLLGIERGCIYSLFVAELYQVSSGRELAWQWSFPLTKDIRCHAESKEMPWKAWHEYSAEETRKIQATITETVDDDVRAAVSRLGF